MAIWLKWQFMYDIFFQMSSKSNLKPNTTYRPKQTIKKPFLTLHLYRTLRMFCKTQNMDIHNQCTFFNIKSNITNENL